MIGDPATAPPRADLTFLRRRSRPRPHPTAPASAPASPVGNVGGSGRIDYTRPDRARPVPPVATSPVATSPSARPATPGPGSVPSSGSRPRIDFSRPGRLPAGASGAAPPVDPRRPPAAPPQTQPASSGALDLSSSPAAPAAVIPSRPRADVPRRHTDRRVAAREQALLGLRTPTVTLTRVQSGVGHLGIEAVCSDDIGDLRLGALYQFRSGGTSTVQHAGGNRFAPSPRRPVIVAGRETYEHLSLDLRQIGDVERVTVYAFSESRQPLRWGGTLVAETFGGARLELPLEMLPDSAVAVLLSLYNLDGELVVRAELESITGDVRGAARAYGYDRITWRDDRTPVD